MKTEPREEIQIRKPRKVPVRTRRAFTLIELLALLAVSLLVAATLLPALCGSKSQTRVAECAANYRQWAVAVNMYAKDNKDWLPRFDLPGTAGNYAWDVGPAFGTNIAPYGLTLPMWFCPVRPNEFQAASDSFRAALGRPLTTLSDLWLWMNRNYPVELQMRHNWWVPRANHSDSNPNNPASAGPTFPPDYGPLGPAVVRGTDPWLYGWPKRVDDRGAARVAFISDACASGNGGGLISPTPSYNVKDISPNTAHFFNGVLYGVNAAYVDGHVEARSPAKMRCVYLPSGGITYWFY